MLSLIKKHTALQFVALFAICLILFTWDVHAGEVTGFDSRFYLFALEMLEKGMSFFPTTYYQPYPDYSAASTILIVLIAKICHGINKFVAVLPTAIIAAATILVTYAIAASYSKRWGFYSVLMLLMTITFLHDARSISLDMYTTFFTTLSFYILLLSDKRNDPKLVYINYGILILGFLFRGPIGLVIPTSVMVSYYFVDQAYKKLIVSGLTALLILILCSILLIILADVEGGLSFVEDVFRMQGFGRMNNSFLPWSFYFTNSLTTYAISFPLALLVIGQLCLNALLRLETRFNHKVLWKLVAWTAIIFLGMSIPGDKKPRYILPAVPAIALLASYLLIALPQEKFLFFMRRLFFKVLVFFPVFFIVLSIYASVYIGQHYPELALHYMWVLIPLFIFVVINLYFFIHQWIIATTATLSFLLCFLWLIEPISLHLDRAREAVWRIEQVRLAENKALGFYGLPPDGLAIKYLINMPRRVYPRFLMTSDNLEKIQQPTVWITSRAVYETLPSQLTAAFSIVAADKIGHAEIIAFKKRE